jgi:hypothetical protein
MSHFVTVTAPFNPETGEEPVSTVPCEKVIQGLRDAVELMNDGGAHWLKGGYISRRLSGEKSYCSMGAVFATAGGWFQPNGQLDPTAPTLDWDLLNAMTAELVRTLGGEPRWVWPTPAVHPAVEGMMVISFNDSDGRSWTEVKSLFESTIERLEKEC